MSLGGPRPLSDTIREKWYINDVLDPRFGDPVILAFTSEKDCPIAYPGVIDLTADDCFVPLDPQPTSVSCEDPNLSQLMLTQETQNIGVNCVDASIDENAVVLDNAPGVLFGATATVTNGNANNFGPGNRYTVSWAGPAKDDFSVSLFPKDAGGSNNGLIPQEVSRTGNSVTFVFRSGDDGQGVDENVRTDFDIIVTGGAADVVTGVFNNGQPLPDN